VPQVHRGWLMAIGAGMLHITSGRALSAGDLVRAGDGSACDTDEVAVPDVDERVLAGWQAGVQLICADASGRRHPQTLQWLALLTLEILDGPDQPAPRHASPERGAPERGSPDRGCALLAEVQGALYEDEGLRRLVDEQKLDAWLAPPYPQGGDGRLLGLLAGVVRRVSADARSGARHRLTATPVGTAPVNGLRIDTDTDLMRTVTVRTADTAMRQLDGGRALHLSTPVESLDDLVRLADHLVMLRHRTDYLTEWEWVEHSVPVDPGPEYDRVLARLAGRIGTPDEPPIELLSPDLAGLDHPAQRVKAAFPAERGEPCHVLPTWEHLRSWLLRTYPDDPGRAVLTRHLRYVAEGAPDLERRTVLEMLHTEFEVDGELYVLNDGTLHRVRAEYLAAVNDFLTAVPTSPFPYYTRGTEGAYLADAPIARPGRLAVLDRQNITLPRQTPFEPCDLVTDGGVLVCAKPKGRSSHFSHLATQAVTSAAMLRNVPAARLAFLNRVREAKGSTPAIESAVRDLRNLGVRVEFATASPPPPPVPVPRRPGQRPIPRPTGAGVHASRRRGS
jgi:uncharacterized protein (TIGR04141 family)